MEGSNSKGAVAVNVNDDFHLHGGGGGEPTISIKVAHGSNQLDLVVPSQSTFGELKRCIAQETGLEPNQQRLLFRGKEKEDQENLHTVGVKDNAKVLLMEEPTSSESKLEEVESSELSSPSAAVAEVRPEVDKLVEDLAVSEGTSEERKVEEVKSSEESRSCAAVAEVRGEVDKLGKQVAALDAAVNGGTKVGEKEFIILPELLMRQLLKLDSIEAEGEGKVQRKQEVRRVQSLVDAVDSLKARNSNPLCNSSKTVSVTTKWETFDSGMGSHSAPPPLPSSTEVTQDWERFD